MPTTILDSNIISSLADPRDTMHEAALAAYRRHESAGSGFGISTVTWSEALVHVHRLGTEPVRLLTELVTQITDAIYSVDTAIAESAARLRVNHMSLRLPDALILATAHEQEDGFLLTADKRLATKSNLVELVTA